MFNRDKYRSNTKTQRALVFPIPDVWAHGGNAAKIAAPPQPVSLWVKGCGKKTQF